MGTWVAASGSETTSAITSDVRSGSGPDFGSIAEGTTVTISQGVLFGFPPSFTVIPNPDADADGIEMMSMITVRQLLIRLKRIPIQMRKVMPVMLMMIMIQY